MPEISKIYDKEMITQLRDVEKSIVEGTLTDDVKQIAKEAEESSVQFLEGYVKGEIKLADDAYDIMVNYLDYLSRSTSPEIKKNIVSARNIYMGERYARQKQKHQQEVIQSMGEIDVDALKKGNFSILDNKKKREALTTAHLIEMGKLMREDKNNDWTKRKNQLEDFAKKRIDDVLSGKKEKDELFDILVQTLGSHKQQETVFKRKQKAEAEIVPPIEIKDEKPSIVIEPIVEKPSINIEPPAEVIIEYPEITPSKPKNKDKPQRKAQIDDNEQYPKPEQFVVLDNKKKASQLSAAELLELSDMIAQVKKAPKKHQFRTDKIENSLRSAAQNLIVKIRKGEVIATDEALDLASRYAPRQREAVNKQKLEQEKSGVIILPPIGNDKDNKKKAKVVPFEPWYKKAWNTVKKPAVAVAAVFILAASSFAIFGNKNKASAKEDIKKPLTEQTTPTNTENKTSQNNKTISFDEVQQEMQKAKQKVQQNQTVSQETQVSLEETKSSAAETSLSKDDAKYATRSASFLKTITKYNKTSKEDPALAEQNLKDAGTRLDNFVNGIKDKLPEGVSVERMKYLASFYRLFPGSEFGKKMTQMFNGEEVSVSKEEIAKLNEAHGKLGQKYINSLHASKANANTGR